MVPNSLFCGRPSSICHCGPQHSPQRHRLLTALIAEDSVVFVAQIPREGDAAVPPPKRSLCCTASGSQLLTPPTQCIHTPALEPSLLCLHLCSRLQLCGSSVLTCALENSFLSCLRHYIHHRCRLSSASDTRAAVSKGEP